MKRISSSWLTFYKRNHRWLCGLPFGLIGIVGIGTLHPFGFAIAAVAYIAYVGDRLRLSALADEVSIDDSILVVQKNDLVERIPLSEIEVVHCRGRGRIVLLVDHQTALGRTITFAAPIVGLSLFSHPTERFLKRLVAMYHEEVANAHNRSFQQ